MISGWLKVSLAMLVIAPGLATARTLAELERALLRAPPQSTPFVEYRFTRLLKKAAIAQGTLEYREAGVWIRTVDTPRAEVAEISNDEIRMRRGTGPERRVALARAPQLRLLLDGLGALLAGRITALNDQFEVTLTSRDESWHLRLVPRDAGLTRKVAYFGVSGTGDAPACIEMAEPDGDASFTLLGGVAESAVPERSSLEARCRSAAGAH